MKPETPSRWNFFTFNFVARISPQQWNISGVLDVVYVLRKVLLTFKYG